MNIINVNKHVLGISVLLASGQIFAQVDNEMLTQQHDHSFMQPMVKHEPPSHEISSSEHINEHGGEIYQSSEFTSKWLNDDAGQGVWQTQLESRIGTDENKLFVQLNAEKTESENTNYDTKFMYSRAMADFWDIQAGIRYIRDAEKVEEKNQTYAAFGLNGLAPYFFDTDIYMYIGKDQQVFASLETDRDFLITQKLVLKPYLDAEVVISDESKYAKSNGLTSLSLGLETRYEITKNIMPYIDVSYGYEKGDKQTNWQDESSSEKKWLYGAGIQFNF